MANDYKSYDDYVDNNDFEGAKKRFEAANGRWRRHWLEACIEIMNKCQEWATKYLIDPIKMTITKIARSIKTAVKDSGHPCVYLIRMFDTDGTFRFLKIGKTNCLQRRLGELSKYHYSISNVTIGYVEVIKTWDLATDALAEACEKAMQHYFNKHYQNIPNDRYAPIEPKAEHIAKFDEIHALLSTL
jgi:hypothetical protein